MKGWGIASLLIGLSIISSACSSSTAQPASVGTAAPSAASTHIEHLQVPSKALEKNMAVDIYLPPGYSSDQHYPVLYVLYGYGGSESTWFGSGLGVDKTADKLIGEGRMKPLIIVSPEYGNSFGVNTVPGQGKNPGGVNEGAYADYLSKELVSYVDQHYSTVPAREGRYVGGFSMGGYAALYLAFTNPELYSKVGGHSAALWDYSAEDQYNDQRDWLFPNDKLRAERDPILLAGQKDLGQLQVYLDVGQSDQFLHQDQKLYDILHSRGIPVEWKPSPGGHDGGYWISHLPDYLMFYAGNE